MRVLAIVRPDAASQPGGDLVYAENVATALRGLGVEVDFVASAGPDARGFDIAHLFGVFEPETARAQIAAIRRARVPLVLSPIWVDLSEYFAVAPQVERALASPDPSREFHRGKFGGTVWWSRGARASRARLSAQRKLVESADFLLPTSELEAALCGKRVPSAIAPMGVGDTLFSGSANAQRRGVLCAGRVESKKNQATLLYALRHLDVDVTIVGRAYDPPYLELCRRWAGPRTRFLEYVPRAELLALMRSTAVHAQPSWCELPGLSSLEAAALGAHIVTGDRGCEREYFAAHASYADPVDPESIKDAVLRALAQPARTAGDAFEQRLRSFTWQRHAEITLGGYERVLEHYAR